MDQLRRAQAFLESFHPATPWALLTLAIWLLVYAVRKKLPSAWLALEGWGPIERKASDIFLALPSVLTGAIASVVLSGGSFQDSWKGALAGAVAPLIHHALKALPLIPYKGATAVPKDAN